MAQIAMQTAVAEVRNDQSGQTVVLPEDFRFSNDRVFLRRDPQTGVITLSEKPSWEDVFRAFDEAGMHDFKVEREPSMPRDIEF